MDETHHILNTLALSLGAAWASGINLYAAILVIGLLGASGVVALPEGMQILQNHIVLGTAGVLYLVEFLADKIPGVDSSWDAVHTLIRIPAGAVLAGAAYTEVDPAYVLAAALVGGGLAAGAHTAKASSRLLVNTSPEPFSNIGISLAEDVVVVGGLWFALAHPWIFLVLLALFLLLLAWALPILLRGVRMLFANLTRLFGGKPAQSLPDTR